MSDRVSGRAKTIRKDREAEENLIRAVEEDVLGAWVPPTRDDGFMKMIDSILSENTKAPNGDNEWVAEARKDLNSPRKTSTPVRASDVRSRQQNFLHAMVLPSAPPVTSPPSVAQLPQQVSILYSGLDFTGKVLAADQRFVELLFRDGSRGRFLQSQIINN